MRWRVYRMGADGEQMGGSEMGEGVGSSAAGDGSE
jgi:hypothetical protein